MKRTAKAHLAGTQPTQPTRSRGSRNDHRFHQNRSEGNKNARRREAQGKVSTRDLDQAVYFGRLKKQKDEYAEQDLAQQLAPVDYSRLAASAIVTSTVVPSDITQPVPADPRTNPLLVGAGANGGFLPPPPI